MLEAVFIKGVDEIPVTGLTQWDRGQMLQITCPDLPSTFQVHFANKKSKTAIVVSATSAGNVSTVAIPDELLRQPLELFAYIYYNDGLIGETVKTIRMPIEKRERPEDYVIELTQEQETNAEKLIKRMMGEYVADEIGAVENAAGYAAQAAESAEAAAQNANSVPTSAEIDEDNLVSFKNNAGVVLFTLDLSDLGSPAVYGALVLSAENLNIEEGGNGTFTVKLASAPSVNQVVYLALSDNTKLNISPATLTFAPDNWSKEQTVTVTAVQDDDKNDEGITVTLTSKKVDSKQLLVSITDNYYVPELVTDGLRFNLNLRGRTADNGENGDHSLVDSVNGVSCTANNVDFDGETDGFVENGLKLKPITDFSGLSGFNQYNPKTYATIQTFTLANIFGSIPTSDTTQKMNMTIEFTGKFTDITKEKFNIMSGPYPTQGMWFTENWRANNGYYGYDAEGTTKICYANALDRAIASDGTVKTFADVLDFTQEHTFAMTFSENGQVILYIDGVAGLQGDGVTVGQTIENFGYWRVSDGYFVMGTADNGAFSTSPKIVSHIRAYNRVLSAEEIKNNYAFDVSQRSVSDF